MNAPDLERGLIQSLAAWEIIDCHEHLPPEKKRLDAKVDVFTLFAHYTQGDLRMAGMTLEQAKSLLNPELPLDQRWQLFKPYWERIRWTCYSRAALLAAQKFYGFDDINDQTYRPLSEAMQQANTPGIYDRVLRQACNIRVALTQCMTTQVESPLLAPLMPLFHQTETWEQLSKPSFAHDNPIESLDDYLNALRAYIKRSKAEGAVGMKIFSNPHEPPSREKALAAFESLRSGSEKVLPWPNPLRTYILDEAIAFSAEQGLVLAVHTGYWGDFRTLDPLHMIPVLIRHPQARFDIYHLGYPWMRETLMLGKGFPNVWLNFCWTHIISQQFATTGLDEAIDLLPSNKILAFGGDYGLPVEKVYGHLVMAREDVARVLARRMRSGQMTEKQALALAHQWFWENPKELYRLKV